MATTPRIGKLTGTITWSDGSPFNGFAEICLVLPVTSANATWPKLSVQQSTPLEVPIWTRVPINGGLFEPSTGLWFNADLTPVGTKYAIYYYDLNGVLLGSPTGLFTISGELTTPPIYTLTVPQSGTAIPAPVEVFG